MAACAADLMECSLCLEEFKDPRALPCLHTFCLDCLIELCDTNQNNGRVKCPMCKEHHRIPRTGAQGFRKDFRMKSFIEVNKAEEIHVKGTIIPNHENHPVLPIKGICEGKPRHLRLTKQAIGQNRKLVQSARKKLEDDRSEMVVTMKTGIRGLEKKIINQIATSRQRARTVSEDDLQQAEGQPKKLKTRFIVRADSDEELDIRFNKLCSCVCIHGSNRIIYK